MIGETLGHYRILDQLGAGGMGEVYRAEDTTLDREVALKVLPPDLSSDPDRLARFEREAKTLAALDHPNIVTIHTVEVANGARFLTMQLVEGKPLSELIPSGGMPLERIFDIATPLADALATAHEKGVIHRDLKPANVMVTDKGQVKVLDFGLAKLRQEVEAPLATQLPTEPLTEEGRIVGTMPYMSPEQLEGENLDSRSDLFSLGVMLYEMATGERPFQGDSSASLITSIMSVTPPPVDKVRSELPHHLARIIEHCLEKNPERRYQSIKDVRNEVESLKDEVHIRSLSRPAEPTSGPSTPELSPSNSTSAGRSKWWWLGLVGPALAVVVVLVFLLGPGGETPAPEPATEAHSEAAVSTAPSPKSNSIAVLPFADMSPNQDQEYFSDGISEELLNLLAKIPELRVTSRSSAFSFKGKDLEIPEIASRLNVAHILEGSVRKAGDQVRITAQLIEAGSDTHLWSETYDRTLDDIFALQDEIAADVVAQLEVTLLGEVPKVQETDPKAYALILQSTQLFRQQTVEGYEQAIERAKEALAIDPEYAEAWHALGASYFMLGEFGALPIDEAERLARDATNKALAIDPGYALSHAILGMLAAGNDLEAAARHLERALSLEPTNLIIIGVASNFAQILGRMNEAIALREYVVARDPVIFFGHEALGNGYFAVGRVDEAIASYQTALALSPGAVGLQASLGNSLLLKGEPEAALEAIEQETGEPSRLAVQAMAYHALGQQAESEAALIELIEKHEQGAAYNIAYVLAFQGDADRAFEWLDKAVEYSDTRLWAIVSTPLFDNLHSDPRWLPFLESIGRSPEQLVAIEFNVTVPE